MLKSVPWYSIKNILKIIHNRNNISWDQNESELLKTIKSLNIYKTQITI